MKKIIHKSNSRGFADHGWLKARHSFSFASWNNLERINFGALRVLNDDIIAPKMGFGTHPHENMEIITIPLKGVLKHRDNMNNDWQSVNPGEVQVMSAGTGVQHSEINGSNTESLSLFQIWIIPQKQNVEPRYAQKMFHAEDRKNKFQTLVTSFDDIEEKSLKIHQDAKISRLDLSEGKTITYTLKSDNHGVYMMLISGEIVLDKENFETKDAIGIFKTDNFKFSAITQSELLFIEVPMIKL
ncbi:pirin family protein [Winogradskyella bathintestinalis]|uniref:Pirin family protein n=1 Tax=Winogradskyella bathintestinalis TaxID=3035208 RepID=A0ABT7ZW99_9FLAO|nr:pirin family protein [Winogradskyella bathintestinalis]MDN3493273.1 pirin family protein [Winogradskyella bathintestinalis]